MRQRIMTALALVASLAIVALAGAQPIRAYHAGDDTRHPFADPAFRATWDRSDANVTPGGAETWLWGPSPYTEGIHEDYAESPGDERLVQYFDKSRMEINHPDVQDASVWHVTNGLLVVEMVEGKLQIGDATFDESPDPAEINIAGDPAGADGVGPTYADINTFALRAEPATAVGAAITSRIDGDGVITTDDALAEHGVAGAMRASVPGIDHTVASVFWNRMHTIGADYDANPYYVTGLPITEAYWSEVAIGGMPHDVLWQCFERRCLTFTPDNEAQWQVEAGNVGQHYYRWRYGEESTPPPTDGATDYTADLGALNDSGVTGSARLTLDGNDLTVIVTASGLTADQVHKMHLYGFGGDKAAACPTSDADTDADGTISLAEATAVAGDAFVPLTPFPAANEDGEIAYEQTITLTAAQLAQLGNPTDAVIMLHGARVGDTWDGDLPVACGAIVPDDGDDDGTPAPAQYTVALDAINASGADGTATLSLAGNQLTIAVQASGLTPDEEHAMHLYGLADGGAAACPVDTDGDGVIDASEGAAAYGEPVLSLVVTPGETGYPVASAEGVIAYEMTFTLTTDQLDALADPAQVVLVIHGMAFDFDRDGGDAPVYAGTLPAACGVVVAADAEA